MRILRGTVRGMPAIAAVIAAMVIGGTAPSRAANLLELNFWLSGPRYEAYVPLCDEPGPLSMIQARFGQKEYRFWNSDLKIVAFEEVREVAFMPWASGTIPRRFCRGKVLVNDGRIRPIHYSIAEDTGILGAKYGVEWCVTGLDRNWAYNPACKMAKP